ncbi:hypothetical protein FZEAL_1578 [Fusarium zealandicum]|uniref:Peptidase M48 domain-containing protein n=1 Tax=Fusarium zealandicum TaxID=1053134 RepID=A0A8H4UT03_9HYPO|nr:hypothetical protein FZEAL_1578 [Fusarium zealandicum]
MLLSRRAVVLVPRTAAASLAQYRLFSRYYPRLSQHQQGRNPYQRLRQALPPVSSHMVRRLAYAGSDRNQRLFILATVLSAVGFYLYNSQTVPVTGRRRFNYLSDAVVTRWYAGAAAEIVQGIQAQGGHLLSDQDPRTIIVRRVMERLIRVSGMKDLDWEIFVIADNQTRNAFVLPGGKVFVFSGLLNTARGTDGLAAVLGHEIAHSTAGHTAERMSAAWVANLTAGSIFFLGGFVPGLALFGLWNVMGGYYLQDILFNLPMGRKQESEADYLGLMMMAEACYDPRAALRFWQRMDALQRSGGKEVPEMMSTHPSTDKRISKIGEWMPRAMEKRAESDCRGTAAFADRFREAIRRRSTTVVV